MICLCDFISFWHNSPHSVRMLWHLKTSVAAIRKKVILVPAVDIKNNTCHTLQTKQENI